MVKKQRILLAILSHQEEEIKKTLVELGYEKLDFIEPDYDALVSEILRAINTNTPYNIVFVANELRHGNGVRFLKHLRNHKNLEVPVIVVYDIEPDILTNLDVIHQRFSVALPAPFSTDRVQAVLKFAHKPRN